jgi:hypothetical protein
MRWTLPDNWHFDRDGRLHCKASPIIRAGIMPFTGQDILGWKMHGLNPNRTYRGYMPRSEVAKAVKHFNNAPLLDRHVHNGYAADAVIGTMASDARMDGDTVRCGLTIWARRALDRVVGDSDLSAGWRADVVLKPGRTPHGEPFDFYWHNIEFNHVVLVPEGREGRCEGCQLSEVA